MDKKYDGKCIIFHRIFVSNLKNNTILQWVQILDLWVYFGRIVCTYFNLINWNLTVSQLLDFIGNHSHGFFVGINFYGIECLI